MEKGARKIAEATPQALTPPKIGKQSSRQPRLLLSIEFITKLTLHLPMTTPCFVRSEKASRERLN